MPSLGIFRLEFLKTVVIFEINTLKFVKNESLTHAVNFGIGSAFSEGLGSYFNEGPGPGLGPLYKVCLFKYGKLSVYAHIILIRKYIDRKRPIFFSEKRF